VAEPLQPLPQLTLCVEQGPLLQGSGSHEACAKLPLNVPSLQNLVSLMLSQLEPQATLLERYASTLCA